MSETSKTQLLYNANVYTLDPDRPRAQALVLRGERILHVGDEALARDWLSADVSATDLEGRALIPGLIDCHVHFAAYALSRRQVMLDGAPSLDEALERVARRAAQTPPGEWVLGRGWDRNLWPDSSFPDQAALDRAAPDHPVALRSKDEHTYWVSSLALSRAHISAATPDPPGGEIVRHPATGQPTGILKENAMGLIADWVAEPSPDVLDAALREAIVQAHRLGLTGIHDCEGPEELRAWQRLARRGELSLRVFMMVPVGHLDAAIEMGLQTGLGDEWLRLGGVKIFADGSLGSRTAAMLAPYEDEPDNLGIPVIPPDEMKELVRRASRAGLSVAIHAIGDQANRIVLDALEECGREDGPHLRHRIEHAQLLAPEDLPRLASPELGLIASMQPIHATADMDMVDRHWGERGRGAYAFRTLLELGGRLAFGSDAPVETLNPFVGIHAAVTRQRADGTPPGGWRPEERISVAQAVHAYTLGAAYASGEERIKGSLTPGKLADLLVLSQDIFTIDPAGILETEPVHTMVGGRWVDY